MKILLTLVVTIFSSFAHASSDGCAHKIIYLQQLPPASGMEPTDRVLQSQYLVAKYLESLPQITIFSESVPQDISTQELRQLIGTDRVKQFRNSFVKGFPGTFEDFQKAGASSADEIALALGKVTQINKIEDGAESENQEQLDGLALKEIANYFANFPSQSHVILLTASPDALSARPDLFPPRCVMTPPDLKAFFNSNPAPGN